MVFPPAKAQKKEPQHQTEQLQGQFEPLEQNKPKHESQQIGPTASEVPVPEEDDSMLNNLWKKLICGVDITEVYSPKRVIEVARKHGLTGDMAMDLITGWDFTR